MSQDVRTPLPNGTRLHGGAYCIESRLGTGGFGITYRARDTGLDRLVAVKEFFPVACERRGLWLAPGSRWKAPDLAAYKGKFQQEGRVLARLRHPGIVQVYSVFEENETVYLVMEFLNGQTLEEYQDAREGRLALDEALGLIRKAGDALTEVHRAGLLHRDLKPANIMRQAGGQVVLIDFGAAREFLPDAIHSQTVILTRGFAPREQYDRRGKRGPFTDVYALSATLYYLITGEVPTEAAFRAIGVPLLTPRELRSDTPASISDAIMRGLALHPEDRPATVEAFLGLFAPSLGTRINPVDGAEMIFIPAGEFLMGSNDHDSEKPQRHVYLDGYWIYKNPVTVAQYKQFCQGTGKQMPTAPPWGWKEDHPMVNVSWAEAQAYSAWAGAALPTEAQWEKAARGTDGREYPWGNAWDASKCRCSKKEGGDAGSTSAVGGYPSGASPYGVLDIAGNVWEWCSDWYGGDYYQSAPPQNPVGPSSGTGRVLRGGSWYFNDPFYFRCANRFGSNPSGRYDSNGFRCVRRADSN